MFANNSLQSPRSLKPIRIWLWILIFMTILMVMMGGATRLTDSGLSITQWDLIQGSLPPFTETAWLAEFEKYKTTDEFKLQNSAMTVQQFKVIYGWEWAHRFLGRLIGLTILLPMIYFWASKRLPNRLKVPVVILFFLVCFQGFLGWWMVKSGLVGRVDVSQIRLAIHLVSACILFAYLIWVSRSLVEHFEAPAPSLLWQGAVLVILLLVQIFLGGLVAGLDAGMAYNDWPKMNGNWVPDGLWSGPSFEANILHNAVTVQFIHRCSAYVVLIAALLHAVWVSVQFKGTLHARRAWLVCVLLLGQAMLGIITLVLQVPIGWALAHQLGGLLVLGFAVAHLYGFKARSVV